MLFKILSTGNTIVCSLDFVEEYYKNDYLKLEDTVSDTEQSKRILTHLEYMSLFKPEELVNIYTLAKTVVDVEIWLDKFKLASDISKDDPETVKGLNSLESAGILAKGRTLEILK